MGIAQMLWVTGTWIATNRVDQHRAAPAVTMAALKLLDGSSKERDPLRGASQEPALPASTSYPQLLATVASCHLRPPTHDRLFRFLLPPGVEYQTAMRAYQGGGIDIDSYSMSVYHPIRRVAGTPLLWTKTVTVVKLSSVR